MPGVLLGQRVDVASDPGGLETVGGVSRAGCRDEVHC